MRTALDMETSKTPEATPGVPAPHAARDIRGRVKKLTIALAVLLGLALVVKFVLLAAREVPDKARFAIDLSALRDAAGQIEACPESARAERVASTEAPAFAAVAGGPFSNVT